MPLTTDPEEARNSPIRPDGQQELYLVLSEEERAKGFVRPVRTVYIHAGARPVYETRPLTKEEHDRYFDAYGYVAYEEYPQDSGSAVMGRFWTDEKLNSGCFTETTMALALAETYARQPNYYGATFCAYCSKHYPVGPDGEFEWLDGTKVGS